MPTFEYQAIGADGNTVNGLTIGASLDQALAELSDKGMQVVRIGVANNPHDPLAPTPILATPEPIMREAPSPSQAPEYLYEAPSPIASSREDARILQQRNYLQTSVLGPIFGRVPLAKLLFFFRQLATMLNAGVPFVQCLDTLSRQARDAKLQKVILEMRDHVAAGRPMSMGMQRYPEVFTPVMLSLTRAGETSGQLDTALRTVADYIEREIELRNLYRRVTFYPKLLVVFSVFIILGTNAIIGSLAPSGQRLSSPLTTWTTWIWLGPLLLGIFLFLRVGLANFRIKYIWDMAILQIPYLGHTLKQLSMAKFGRAFGALYHGGVPIQQALLMSADACGNEYLRSRIYPAEQGLKEGGGVAASFRHTGAFTDIVMDMVSTGETTGNLDQMLGKVSEYYEDEAETRSKQFGQVIGVVVYLMVAGYILYIVLTFYTGYFGGMMKAGE
ncbi:MAG TPA: type II secretion system F family protein [Fimbriimonas sp.]